MNAHKTINFPLLFPIILLTLVVGSCDADDSFTIENPKVLDFQSFTLEVPQDWTSFTQQGIDTYVGGLTNKIDTLYFDYGYLSFGSLDDIKANDETLSFQALKIDGEDAKIVKETRAEETEIRYSLYVDKRDQNNLNRLYVYGLTNEQLITAIFLSHKFTD